MLSEQTIRTVKSTIPLIESASEGLTDHFYRRMFLHNPELKDVFNMSHQHSGRQRAALYDAIAAYAKHMDNLAVLTGAVERIAHKHSSFGIHASQYDIVGHHLIETLRELTGAAFTDEVEDAWVKAYEFLAGIFIARENDLYSEREHSQGGWRGSRLFNLVEKHRESDLVQSFVFEPMDKKAVLDYHPGQYLGVEVKPTLSDFTEIRQYSLSGKSNGRQYRISVKREGVDHPGTVSHYLHDDLALGDTVSIRPPCGDFYFVERDTPTVLISAGVGLTPMQAILETLYERQAQQPVVYLHACNHENEHTFKSANDDVFQSEHATQYSWKGHVWYLEQKREQKREQKSKHDGSMSHLQIHEGLMDLSQVQLHLSTANFYLCGPVAFMAFVKEQLVTQGVDDDRIHYEVFGPHETL